MKFIVMVIVPPGMSAFAAGQRRRKFSVPSYTCEIRTLMLYHIADMAFGGADVRDTAKTLKIAVSTPSSAHL